MAGYSGAVIYWQAMSHLKQREIDMERLYKLQPGDHIALGIGNFAKKPRVGDQYEDLPMRVEAIRYTKGIYSYPKKWWQFWISKKRLLIIVKYIGWENWSVINPI